MREQEDLAVKPRAFLQKWGLKAKYVAEKCGLSSKVMSGFLNFRLALSESQYDRLGKFDSDYEARNG